MDTVKWRKANASGGGGCVEVAVTPDGRVALRDSKAPERGMLCFDQHAFADLVTGIKHGDYDEFARPVR